MYQFVSGFINITDLKGCSMAGMHHLACQPTFRLHLILLFFMRDNWLTFNFEDSKCDHYPGYFLAMLRHPPFISFQPI